MNNISTFHKVFSYLIAAVWLINGLFCKLLNLVPRHQQIVERILGDYHPGLITKAIGFSEVLMAVWILTGIKHRLNAIAQILIIGIMNSIEFLMARDLLLWGKWNAVFAGCFMLLIFYNESFLAHKPLQQA